MSGEIIPSGSYIFEAVLMTFLFVGSTLFA